jgi:hypothetical protein
MAVIGRLVYNVQTPMILRNTAVSLQHTPSDFLLGLLFYPEDRGDMFLRDVGLPRSSTALQPRIPYSCCSESRDSNRFQKCCGNPTETIKSGSVVKAAMQP